MSYEYTLEGLELLNDGINRAYEQGEPITAPVDGQPHFEIIAFEPLVYETYGLFRNRAPQITDTLELRRLIPKDTPQRGINIYAALGKATRFYGFPLRSYVPEHREALRRFATEAGHPEVSFGTPR